MRDFVRDDVAAHLGRGEDQPPVEPDPALRRAAAQRVPASPMLTARGRDPGARRRIRRSLATSCRERGRLRNARPAAPGRSRARRSAARRREHAAFVASAIHTIRTSLALDRDRRARSEGSPARRAASCASIHSRWSSAQASAARRLVRHGQVSLSTPLASSKPQAQPPRAAQRANLDRQPAAPPPGGFRAAVRPHDIPARRRRLR